MKLTVLMENEAATSQFCCAFGLSLYLETGGQRILFDAGPDGGFADNARALGIDLSRVDLAVLSHSHYDHGDGLSTFFALNASAPVYARSPFFAPCFSLHENGPEYVGLRPQVAMCRERILQVEGDLQLDPGLWLFRSSRDFPAAPSGLMVASGKDLVPDPFLHEHSLLVTEGDRAVVLAGCSHRGIVNIVRRAVRRLGRTPDAVVGGFHLMNLKPDDPEDLALLERTARALEEGETVYYSGHCTGDFAFSYLSRVLGDRLCRVRAGSQIEL